MLQKLGVSGRRMEAARGAVHPAPGPVAPGLSVRHLTAQPQHPAPPRIAPGPSKRLVHAGDSREQQQQQIDKRARFGGARGFVRCDSTHRCLLLTCFVSLGYVAIVSAEVARAQPLADHFQRQLWMADVVVACGLLLDSLVRAVRAKPTALNHAWTAVGATVSFICVAMAITEVAVGDQMSHVNQRVLRLVMSVYSIMLCRFTSGGKCTKLSCAGLWLESTQGRTADEHRSHQKLVRPASFTSRLEHCLDLLHRLQLSDQLSESGQSELEDVIELLRQGNLYQPMKDATHEGKMVDDQTAAWMQTEIAASFMAKQQPDFDPADIHLAEGLLSADDLWELEDENTEVRSLDDPQVAVTVVGPLHERRRTSQDVSPASADHKSLAKVRSMRLLKRQGSESLYAQLNLMHLAARARSSSSGAHNSSIWKIARHTVHLRRALRHVNAWLWDAIKADELTFGHSLFVVTYHLVHCHGLVPALRLDDAKLQRLLLSIESGYLSNPYHNSIHASDVVQSMHYFMVQPLLLAHVTPLQILSALLAAAIHDYAHPGLTNAFEVATRSKLAVLYNDASVLENMHVSAFFQMIESEDSLNLLACLHAEDFKRLRQQMIQLVLGTDMTRHFEDVTKLKSKLVQAPAHGAVEESPNNHPLLASPADVQFVLQVLMHTADVSNPARPLCLSRQWARRVTTEFYAQGDRERTLGLPISAFFDRHLPKFPQLQMSFIDFIVAPLFTEWANIIEDVDRTALPLIHANRVYWQKQYDAELAAVVQMS